ncbi:MAG: hypothetical protein ACF8R7_18445 [Phycisphaerales bacterium JB039]
MRQIATFALAAAVATAPALAQRSLNDSFECYQPGDLISQQPGWELWFDPPGHDAVVTHDLSFSGSQSLQLHQAGTDVLRRVSYKSERVIFRAMTYVPSTSQGLTGYVLALGMYEPPWFFHSMTVEFDSGASTVTVWFAGVSTPLIYDRWVELRAEIDLAADGYALYYDGGLVGDDITWSPFATSPILTFQAIDLYMDRLASGPGMYIDDIVVTQSSVTPPPTCGVICYADCDVSGATDLFDFLCFQNLFAAADLRADCDQSGALDLFDFLCFQNNFAAGCP